MDTRLSTVTIKPSDRRLRKRSSEESVRAPWTSEEDRKLRTAVEHYRGKNWKRVAECLEGRTRAQCAHRWQKVLNPNIKKGAWSLEEDKLLREALQTFGAGKWSRIATVVPGRNGKQCRERWYNHLQSDVKKDPWSTHEDHLIVHLRSLLGNKWAAIARMLPGRTENAVKNRWNAKLGLDPSAHVLESELAPETAAVLAELKKKHAVKVFKRANSQSNERKRNLRPAKKPRYGSLDTLLQTAEKMIDKSATSKTETIKRLPKIHGKLQLRDAVLPKGEFMKSHPVSNSKMSLIANTSSTSLAKLAQSLPKHTPGMSRLDWFSALVLAAEKVG